MGRGQGRRSVELIEASLEILADIQPCSIRAVCYRLFSAGLIEDMSKNSTNRVSRILTAARIERQILWHAIVDETREREAVATWSDPTTFGRAVMASYRRNKWTDQPVRVEVLTEK